MWLIIFTSFYRLRFRSLSVLPVVNCLWTRWLRREKTVIVIFVVVVIGRTIVSAVITVADVLVSMRHNDALVFKIQNWKAKYLFIAANCRNIRCGRFSVFHTNAPNAVSHSKSLWNNNKKLNFSTNDGGGCCYRNGWTLKKNCREKLVSSLCMPRLQHKNMMEWFSWPLLLSTQICCVHTCSLYLTVHSGVLEISSTWNNKKRKIARFFLLKLNAKIKPRTS